MKKTIWLRLLITTLVWLVGTFSLVAHDGKFNKKTLEQQLRSLPEKKQKRFVDSLSIKYSQGEFTLSKAYLDFCIDYAWKNKFDDKRIGNYFFRRASMYRKTWQYEKALSDYARAEQIYMEIKNDDGLQSVYSGYAGIYSRIGENLKAIKYIRRALQKSEITHNLEATGVAYNDLATAYRQMQLYDSAIHAYRKAYYSYKDKDLYSRSLLLDNISMVFQEKNEIDSAVYYNNRAFQTAKPLNDAYLELQLLFSVVGISEKSGNYNKQLKASLRSLQLADSLQMPFYHMICAGNYAVALKNLNRNTEAIQVFRSVLPAIKASENPQLMANFYEEISSIYDKLNQPDSALYYYKLTTRQKDTLAKLAENDRVNEIIARFGLEEKEKNIQHLKKQKSEEQEKGRLKSIIIWVAAGMMVLVGILLVIIIMRYRENRRLSKNLAIKQKEIVDSINYAKRIQYALLAHDDLLKKNLPEHFVLFKPKDIVSGDFYWATRAVRGSVFGVQNNNEQRTENTEHFYLAVCDSTGHGVPGAFMSLLNISFLNEAITEKGIEKPNEVFNHVRQRLIENIAHDGAQDGMDATLVKFKIQDSTFEIEYAAAHHSPVIIRQGEVISLPYDKMHIGKGESVNTFTLQTVQVQKGDMLYLFTDGYGDQFGGERGKKFKDSQLRSLFAAIAHLPAEQQRKQLENTFTAWKGQLEQIDDVCVIGVRI